LAEVIVSRLARNDLIHIRDYIQNELSNPDAALRIMAQLKQAMESLQTMPERGKALDAILAVHTQYRFLVCESYRIFYLYDAQQVEVVRVLHTLQDYMRALFLS
jgi:plasmid stabilization system protein ParE